MEVSEPEFSELEDDLCRVEAEVLLESPKDKVSNNLQRQSLVWNQSRRQNTLVFGTVLCKDLCTADTAEAWTSLLGKICKLQTREDGTVELGTTVVDL